MTNYICTTIIRQLMLYSLVNTTAVIVPFIMGTKLRVQLIIEIRKKFEKESVTLSSLLFQLSVLLCHTLW